MTMSDYVVQISACNRHTPPHPSNCACYMNYVGDFLLVYVKFYV